MHICLELTGTISHCSSFPIDVFLANQSPGTGHKPKSHLFKTDYFFAGTPFAPLQLSNTGFDWCKPTSSLLEVKAGFSLCTVQLWQVKADEMPPLWGNSAAA